MYALKFNNFFVKSIQECEIIFTKDFDKALKFELIGSAMKAVADLDKQLHCANLLELFKI